MRKKSCRTKGASGLFSSGRTFLCCHEGVSSRPIHVLTAGVPLGEVKGRDAVPSAALALGTALRPEAFATVDLPRLEALRYLRREALSLPADVPRGYVLAAYDGLPLGFMKQLGPRANNLFPDEWRIRKTLI